MPFSTAPAGTARAPLAARAALAAFAFVMTGAAACGAPVKGDTGVAADASSEADADAASPAPAVIVHAVFELPRSVSTEGLSGTAFDPGTRTLFALQDTRPSIVPLVASADFTTFTVGAAIPLSGRPEAAWDGEALVRDADGFIAVTVETAPKVERFGTAGAFLAALPMPARFARQAPGNKGLESLALSPSGRFLFTANESALTTDGAAATKERGTTVRILRRERATGADTEVAYRTEPLGAGGAGDMGISELAALDDDHLLVLERGFQAGYGNTARIFRVDVASGARVESTDALTDATPVLTKTLVVDLGTLPAGAVTHPGLQPNPLLDNYEALAVGPTLADGRRLLFVTSDDNASTSQVARVLVLAATGL